ncbi:MAG: M48 family metallopeptidase [Alphaproteobacteria bacterium]|nr:M48 family metallopeptidase [Alphaproteobacteria bacterium]
MASAVGLQTHIWNNNAKSVMLLVGYPLLLILMLFAFFAFLGGVTGQPYDGTQISRMNSGLNGVRLYWHWAVGLATAWFLIAWMFHQSMINRSTGARPATRAEYPDLYNSLENLCISRGLTMPQLYIIDNPALNAYASGLSEKSYAITVTTGLMRSLNREEIEAVLGHELTHIMNRDVRLLVIGVIFAGMISFFAEMAFRGMVHGAGRSRGRNAGGVMLVAVIVLAVGYLFSLVIRMAISRRREYLADAGAVELTRNPDAMVSALRRISGNSKIEGAPAEIQQMFIENPPAFAGLFSTHPPIESRIDALVRYAGAQDLPLSAPEAELPPQVQHQQKGPWGALRRRGPWGG